MKKIIDSNTVNPNIFHVSAGNDKFGEHRSLGVSSISFKVTPMHNNDILIIENTFHEKGGPAKHLHFYQDEWFYIIKGEFLFEVDTNKFRLNPGDSIFAPRNVPHVWAFNGESDGSILITFTPAGKMESFFREITKANAMPPLDPELWRMHEMELLGLPLKL